MFERFTERARQIVVLAQADARKLEVRYIGPEHLLLGILAEKEGLAGSVLNDLGVDYPAAYEVVSTYSGGSKPEGKEKDAQIPFTPRAQKCLELALRAALDLGHNYIGTEHVLLGILREGDNNVAQILRDHFGLARDTIRDEIIKELSGSRAPILDKGAKVVQARDPKDDLDVIASAVTLGRLYPNVRAETIAKAAISFAE